MRDSEIRKLLANLAQTKQLHAALERSVVKARGLAIQIHADAGALSVGEGSVSRAIPAVMEELEEEGRAARELREELREAKMETAGVREKLARARELAEGADLEKREVVLLRVVALVVVVVVM